MKALKPLLTDLDAGLAIAELPKINLVGLLAKSLAYALHEHGM